MKDIPGDTASLVRLSKEKSKDFWQTQHTVKATIMLFLPHVPLTYCPQLLLEGGGKPTESELLFNSATVALTIRSPLEPPALPTGINHSRASAEPLTKSSLKDKPCEVLWTLPVGSCYTSDIYWEFTAEGAKASPCLEISTGHRRAGYSEHHQPQVCTRTQVAKTALKIPKGKPQKRPFQNKNPNR